MRDWDLGDRFLDCWVLVERIAEATNRVLETRLGRFGMTKAQYRVLALLYFLRIPLSQKQIASCLFRQQPGISELLMRMEASGYLERINLQSVERFRMTPEGRRRLDQVWPSIVEEIRTLLSSCFSEEEIACLQGMLKRLHDRMLETLQEDGIVCDTESFPDTIATKR